MNLSWLSPIPPTTNLLPPVLVTPIKASELHVYWPFLHRGLEDIRRKVSPDWLCEDVYGALRAEVATAIIVSRGTRLLGFGIYHRQERPWSHKLDLFLWAAWALPLRERLPTDGMAEAVARGIEYLRTVQRSIAADRIIAISSRRGLIRRFGCKELFFTLEI